MQKSNPERRVITSAARAHKQDTSLLVLVTMRFALQSSAIRQSALLGTRRWLSVSHVARAEPIAGVEKIEAVKPREPIGGFRGG